jgi:hypothetical protein
MGKIHQAYRNLISMSYSYYELYESPKQVTKNSKRDIKSIMILYYIWEFVKTIKPKTQWWQITLQMGHMGRKFTGLTLVVPKSSDPCDLQSSNASVDTCHLLGSDIILCLVSETIQTSRPVFPLKHTLPWNTLSNSPKTVFALSCTLKLVVILDSPWNYKVMRAGLCLICRMNGWKTILITHLWFLHKA